MPQRKNNSKHPFVAKGEKDRILKANPDVIDPDSPEAARRFNIEQRGGVYGDKIRVSPPGTENMTGKPPELIPRPPSPKERGKLDFNTSREAPIEKA